MSEKEEGKRAFIAVVGGVEEGFGIYGPFERPDTAILRGLPIRDQHAKNFECPALAMNTIAELIAPLKWVSDTVGEGDAGIEDKERVEIMPTDGGKHVVVAGDLFQGHAFIGPFMHSEDALWVAENFTNGYLIVELGT